MSSPPRDVIYCLKLVAMMVLHRTFCNSQVPDITAWLVVVVKCKFEKAQTMRAKQLHSRHISAICTLEVELKKYLHILYSTRLVICKACRNGFYILPTRFT